MPYPPQHREQVRERIIQSARKLFNRGGFIAVSIDEVMASAGLTRGSFYSYFKSKSELYSEMIGRFVSEIRNDHDFDPQARDRAARILRDHLSRPEKNEPETNFPLLSLYSDLSQVDRTVIAAFESALKLMIDTFEHGATGSSDSARQRAMALVSLCVGGKVLADWIEDPLLAQELQKATLTVGRSLL
jgi:AcrR family transcriptional regulator